jgi:putative hemolysin
MSLLSMHMTNRNSIYLIAGLIVAGAVLACGCLDQKTQSKEQVTGNGTITYVDLEGGFYGIITEGGDRYYPLDLPDDYKVDGMRVRFTAIITEDTVTVQQWGTPAEIAAIERIDGDGTITADGTVTYVDLEGGFYGIVADDGGQYLPANLSEEFAVDGKRVHFTAVEQQDVVTIQMWGTPVEILTIEETNTTAPAIPGEGLSGIANPAAVYCIEQGYAYEIRTNPDGSEYGVCIFENGTEVDAWEFYYQNH